MDVDKYFFTKTNFTSIKNAIVSEIISSFQYDMTEDVNIDEDIIKIMEYVHLKIKNNIPVNTTLNQLITMMNDKVYVMIIKRIKTKLKGNIEDLLEKRRQERNQQLDDPTIAVQAAMQQPDLDVIDGPRVIHEAAFDVNDDGQIQEHDNNEADIINNLHANAGGMTDWDDEPAEFLSNPEPEINSYATIEKEEKTQYLTIDSRFRDLEAFPNADSFTVKFDHPVNLTNITCINLIAPNISKRGQSYLLLKIDQLNGNYYNDDIFAKLIQNGNNSYVPAIDGGVTFDIPQRVGELSLQLLTPNRSRYAIDDLADIKCFELARGGNLLVTLNRPTTRNLESGDRVCLYQLLDKNEVMIHRQQFNFRPSGNSSAWIYGNFEQVTPKKGDLVRFNDNPKYHRVLDGQDRGAMLVENIKEDVLKTLEYCTFLCRATGDEQGWYNEGVFDHSFYTVTKIYTDGGSVDKFEIDYKYENLQDRDHLGERKIMIEHLQTSYTFKLTTR